MHPQLDHTNPPVDESGDHTRVTNERTPANPWDSNETSLALQPLSTTLSHTLLVSKPSKQQVQLRRLAILFIISSMVIVTSLALYSYLSVRIWPHTLTTESHNQTSFLRPNAWAQLPTSNSAVFSYGNNDHNGTSSALITMMKLEAPFTDRDTASLQTEIDETFTDEYLAKSTDCTDMHSIHREKTNTLTATTTHLMRISYSCRYGQVDYQAMMNILVGKDDYVRFGMILASKDEWLFNGDIYTKMLSSIEQSPTVTLR